MTDLTIIDDGDVVVEDDDVVEVLPPGLPESAYDYRRMPVEVRGYMRQAAAEIRRRYQRAIDDWVAIGSVLLQVKEAVGHGEFIVWLEAEFDWTDRQARNFMSVAKRLDVLPPETVSVLRPTAVALLVTAPEPVRHQVVAQVADGTVPTVAEVRQLVREHRASTKAERASEPVVRTMVPEAPVLPDTPLTPQLPVADGRDPLEAALDAVTAGHRATDLAAVVAGVRQILVELDTQFVAAEGRGRLVKKHLKATTDRALEVRNLMDRLIGNPFKDQGYWADDVGNYPRAPRRYEEPWGGVFRALMRLCRIRYTDLIYRKREVDDPALVAELEAVRSALRQIVG